MDVNHFIRPVGRSKTIHRPSSTAAAHSTFSAHPLFLFSFCSSSLDFFFCFFLVLKSTTSNWNEIFQSVIEKCGKSFFAVVNSQKESKHYGLHNVDPSTVSFHFFSIWWAMVLHFSSFLRMSVGLNPFCLFTTLWTQMLLNLMDVSNLF